VLFLVDTDKESGLSDITKDSDKIGKYVLEIEGINGISPADLSTFHIFL